MDNGFEIPPQVGPDIFPGVLKFSAGWAGQDGRATQPVESTVAQNVTRTQFLDSSGDARVVLYTLKGIGHQWPGGKALPEFLVGPYSRDINATELMWEFFSAHPLPGK